MVQHNTALVEEAFLLFLEDVKKYHPSYEVNDDTLFDYSAGSVDVEVVITGLADETNERYMLAMQMTGEVCSVKIIGASFYGARHGLETLSQLMAYDEFSNGFIMVSEGSIEDEPVYKYRGITLDTARHFFNVQSIKNILDGMSYIKLNHFHWHLTDSNSFPFDSPSVPEMSKYGAHTTRQIYTAENISDIVHYAKVRGIRIIPEIDAPAHAGYGWQWTEENGKCKTVYCLAEEPWNKWCLQPPCGQLNPLCPDTYDILGYIYKDLYKLFPNDVYHMGGDEISEKCWSDSSVAPETAEWLKTGSLLELWGGIFQKQAFDKLKEATENSTRKIILWESHLTKPDTIVRYLNKNDYIVHLWGSFNNSDYADLVNQGYEVIFANNDKFYLDCGFGEFCDGGNNWCDPYKDWQTIYDTDPYQMLTDFGVDLDEIIDPWNKRTRRDLVLGGSAALWTETVNEGTVEGKIFPRIGALAERLWSNPAKGWKEGKATWRMATMTDRIAKRGIRADPIQPEWCLQNEGRCPPSTP